MAKLTRINDVYVNLDEVAAIEIRYYWNHSKPYHVIIHTGSDTIKEDLTSSEGKHLEALLKERLN